MNVGPGNDRENTVKLGDNQSFTQAEGDAFEALQKAGLWGVDFALLPDQRIKVGISLSPSLVTRD